jgi:hypothetical protein
VSPAFEDYYANQHVPFASEHMANVTGAGSALIAGAPDGAEPGTTGSRR